MTLLNQFALISLLPATLLLQALYILWTNVRQRRVALPVALALLTAAVWASGALTFYSGGSVPMEVRLTWRVVSNHALSLLPLWLFLATAIYLGLARRQRWLTLAAALLLWLLSFSLDPAIWHYDLPPFLLFGQMIRHFDLWAAVWATASLLPLSVAWGFTYRATHQMPSSFYRNQTDYWLLALSTFLLAVLLALPRLLLVQQAAILLAIGGGFSSAAVLIHNYLPNLQVTLRRLARTLLVTAVVFSLSWLALLFAGEQLPAWPAQTRNAGLAALAGLFALLFLLISSTNGRRSRHLIPGLAPATGLLNDHTTPAAGALTPAEVGSLAVKLIQSRLACDDVWLLTVTPGAGGELELRTALATSRTASAASRTAPAPSSMATPPAAVALPADALLTRYFRRNRAPLLQYDLDYGNDFATLSEVERSLLTEWQRTLFAPLHVGERLVGILALGEKQQAEPYDQADVAYLEEIAGSLGFLLAQAQQVSGLARTVDYLSEHNRALAYEKQRLQELAGLYHDFLSLIGPELRQPFAAIERDLERIEALVNSGRPPAFDHLHQQINCVKEMVTNLVNMAARVQQQHTFSLQPLLLDEIVREVQQALENMAMARRVKVELDLQQSSGVLVYGDSGRLTEAVQQLVHNAIKFNKMGGLVRVESGVNGHELFLHVSDNGVGIPEERLATIWCSFADLESINVYNPKGAGTGLLLTRFIVQAHGGRVEARSSYGRGSVFSLYLPTVLAEAGQATN